MEGPSGMNVDIDYQAVTSALLGSDHSTTSLSQALSDAWSDVYRAATPSANLYEFNLAGWSFLFDFASESDAPQWDRTLAGWGLSAPGVRPRDTTYQRGYPSPNGRAKAPLDKGHLIPHQVGGDLGQNIFPQDRDLNRGWSEEGKRYRALEREIGRSSGTFFFCRLVYVDETDFPGWVELGVLRGAVLHVERFRNRFD